MVFLKTTQFNRRLQARQQTLGALSQLFSGGLSSAGQLSNIFGRIGQTRFGVGQGISGIEQSTAGKLAGLFGQKGQIEGQRIQQSAPQFAGQLGAVTGLLGNVFGGGNLSSLAGLFGGGSAPLPQTSGGFMPQEIQAA